MHGGSGTPVDQVQNAIRNGISKVNLYADLRIAMFNGVKKSVTVQKRIDPLPDELFEETRIAIRNVVLQKIAMTMSENKA